MLTVYFAWKNNLQKRKTALVIGLILFSLIFINFLPLEYKSDTLVLSCIHLPLFLWSILGFTFVGNCLNHYEERLQFLKYSGDLLVISTLILISGAILSGITIGLFSLIELHIENFYFQNIVIFGLAATPIVGTYIIQTD